MEFIDLKKQYEYLKSDIDCEIGKVLSKGHFILGENVDTFEEELSKYLNVKNVITCSDGTSALQLIYMAYNIGKGDVIFCPDMTFIASIEPACLLGATPVFCDIDNRTYNISAESLERQIIAVINQGKLNPKAVVAVDFLGNPADYDALNIICKKYNLLLIEDAAQGMGAKYKGKKCGSLADIAATSFFPTKPLGCYGDGGAVFTNDDNIANIIRSLRVHGRGIDKYHNIAIGVNSRLDEIQAAVLRVKLKNLNNEISLRKKVAQYYDEKLIDNYQIPFVMEQCVSSYAQYCIVPKEMGKRELIVNKLKENKIPSILYYPVPLHKLPVFNGIECYDEDFASSTKYSDEHLGIPFSPYISRKEQQSVVEAIQHI